MRNFKDIIIEKLKVSTNNTVKLPHLEDFEEAVYNFNNAHEVYLGDVDSKYRELKNCPQYEHNDTIYYVVSLFEAMHINHSKYLYAFCSKYQSSHKSNFMITSMNQLIEVLGEELVLQIWDYIK